MLWQHLIGMVIDKIYKMTVEGVKSKSESFFSISHGVLELWRKTLGGRIPPPPVQIGLRKNDNLNAIVSAKGETATELKYLNALLKGTDLISLVLERSKGGGGGGRGQVEI